MHPLCKILNTPVMSICLVKQNDGMWVEKHQRFLFNVYKRFFIFVTFFTFFNVFLFFSGTFFYIYDRSINNIKIIGCALVNFQYETFSRNQVNLFIDHTLVVDGAVSVQVSLADHLIHLVVGQLLAEVRHHVTQLRRADVTAHINRQRHGQKVKCQGHTVPLAV